MFHKVGIPPSLDISADKVWLTLQACRLSMTLAWDLVCAWLLNILNKIDILSGYIWETSSWDLKVFLKAFTPCVTNSYQPWRFRIMSKMKLAMFLNWVPNYLTYEGRLRLPRSSFIICVAIFSSSHCSIISATLPN